MQEDPQVVSIDAKRPANLILVTLFEKSHSSSCSPLLAGSQGPFERGPVPRRPRQSPPRSLVCPESDHRCHRPAGRRASGTDCSNKTLLQTEFTKLPNPPGDWMPPGCLTARNTRRNVSWMASSMSADERTRERSDHEQLTEIPSEVGLGLRVACRQPIKVTAIELMPFIAQAARSYVLARKGAMQKLSSCTRRRRHDASSPLTSRND